MKKPKPLTRWAVVWAWDTKDTSRWYVERFPTKAAAAEFRRTCLYEGSLQPCSAPFLVAISDQKGSR